MDTLQSLLAGFQMMFTPAALLWGVIGSFVGTLVGAIPGLGPSVGVAVLMPLSFALDQVPGLILLISVYLGAMYGGRISSILINTPGDAAAIMTCVDGYPLTKQGRGGIAMGISGLSSFFGGMIGIIFMTFCTPLLTGIALAFGTAEQFSVMLFSLIAISAVSESKQSMKGILMAGFGLLLALVGADYVTGKFRLTFGVLNLMEGIDYVVASIGLFGLSEVLLGIEKPLKERVLKFSMGKGHLFPSGSDIREAAKPTLIGTLVGVVVGVLPGAGATIATFVAYGAAKKASKHPEKFGNGSIEGVSAPEAANNACVAGALTPMLALGIPGSSVAAMIMGAFIVHDLQPGPLLFIRTPDTAWGVIAALYIVNVILLLMNTLIIPLFVKLIQIAQSVLYPVVSVFCVIGVYSLHNSMFDVGVMFVFGVLGYLLKKGGFPIAGLLLALILGPTIESTFRQSLILSGGSYSIFLTRPVSAALLILSLLVVLYPFLKGIVKNSLGRKDIAEGTER